jgi:hypothetical protein
MGKTWQNPVNLQEVPNNDKHIDWVDSWILELSWKITALFFIQQKLLHNHLVIQINVGPQDVRFWQLIHRGKNMVQLKMRNIYTASYQECLYSTISYKCNANNVGIFILFLKTWKGEKWYLQIGPTLEFEVNSTVIPFHEKCFWCGRWFCSSRDRAPFSITC